MYKKTTKLIASILVVMLTMSHISIVGEVLASSIENQIAKTNQANVEFDAYFDVQSEAKHEATKNIGEENFINASITVKKEGYLKDAVVEVKDSNFELIETQNEQISKIEENKIYFNQIQNENTSTVSIPIKLIEKERINPEELSKTATLELNAIYVDGKGKEKEVNKDIKVKLTWAAENAQADFDVQIAKFVPYQIKENKGLVLQTLVQSNVTENSMPVKTNKIEIEIPTVNNIEPDEVKVLANSLAATNGDLSGENFNEENYVIENNKLTITTKNEPDEKGNISWKKDVKDEFIITYKYSEEALNSITEEGVKIQIKGNNEIILFDANNTKIEKEYNGEIVLKDQISNLVDFYIETEQEKISKGQIYANYNVENKIETEYKETVTASVGLAELTDKVIVEINQDNFIIDEENKSPVKESYIKELKLNKGEFDKMLGEDGSIIISANAAEIAKIDKESKEEDYTIDLSELNINKLNIETSKPLVEGKLNFVVTKRIKGDIGFAKSEVSTFNKLEANIMGQAESEGDVFVKQDQTKQIELTEPTMQAELQIDNNKLSTVVVNENVKINAILKTDTLDCALYQNPTVEITLPSYIENIEFKNIEVLFEKQGSELTLTSSELVQNEDGTKTIKLKLEGIQTEYSLGAVSKGLNIIITANLKLNRLTPNKQDKITMTCTNNTSSNIVRMLRATSNTNEVMQTVSAAADVSVVAPVGVITISKISGYKENAEVLEAMSGAEKTAVIETLVGERTANFNMSVVNNYNNTIDNVSILGRTMFKGNKDIVTGNDLGSTFNTKLKGAIEVKGIEASNYTVYYSENANATKDLSLDSNGWEVAPASFDNIKSYLIVLASSYEMQTGSSIEFNYDAIIPEKLQHNESAYENYVVYFNNNLSTGMVEDKQQSTKLGVTTGVGPVLEATLSSSTNKELQKGDTLTYTITVKNTGTETATNVMAKLTIPQGLQYVEPAPETTSGYKVIAGSGEYNVPMGNIAAGGTATKELLMQVTDIVLIPIVNAKLERPTNEGSDFKNGDRLNYTLVINNEGTATANNVKVKISIPKWLKYIDSNTSNVIATEGEYTLDIGTVKPNETITKELLMEATMDRTINIEIEDEDLTEEEEEALAEHEHEHPDEENEVEIDEELYDTPIIVALTKEDSNEEKDADINVKLQVTADNVDGTYDTENTNKIGKAFFNTNTSIIKENSVLKEGDSFSYKISVFADANSSTIENTKLEIALPQEIDYESTEVKDSKEKDITDQIHTSYNKNTRKLIVDLGTIDSDNIKNIYINVKVGKLDANVYDKKVSIDAVVSGTDVSSKNIEIEEVEIGKVGFKVTQTSSIPANATISGGEDFTYTFTIENLSNINVPELKITDVLPEELIFSKVTIKDSEGNTTYKYDKNEEGNVEFTTSISAKETITADVSVRAQSLGQSAKISNKANAAADGMEGITTNTITHTIAKFELYTEEGGNTPSVQGNKRIMGTVWIDKDSNGSRDEGEEVVADVDMLLFNNDTAMLVTDSEGNVLRAKTDKDGIYSFTNIAKGKYTVIFLYDIANYSATTYRKDGVNSDQNSDAVDSKITLDGVTRVAAITEEVAVNDNNVYNIDLGLVENPKFDLKLDKTVSKITVQHNTGTNVYEFNDTKLAKKELVGKQIANTTIIVEYKIKITNEGAIAGYVKKIADYMPTEMKFNSELNKDWYTSENGILYNSSLANVQINPGETKEVTLLLTKKMTENNLGLYHNQAEIAEAYNDLGIEDMDSTPGNKASTEDDISSADILISVKTGEVAIFIGLSVSIIATITIAAYIIKKKVIR